MAYLNPYEHLRRVLSILATGLRHYVKKKADSQSAPIVANLELREYLARKRSDFDQQDVTPLLCLLHPSMDRAHYPPAFAGLTANRVADSRLLIDILYEIRTVRNAWAHMRPIGFDQAEIAASGALNLLRAVAPERRADIAALERLHRELHLRLPVADGPAAGDLAFWDDSHFDLTDKLNEEIWATSSSVQMEIAPPASLTAAGSAGAQQAMIDGVSSPLPWIPDLLGRQWKDETSLIVIGFTYSGIVAEYSSRFARMPLSTYRGATTSTDFQRRFIETCVRNDPSYYGFIRSIVGTKDASQLALLDLCRASFVVRGEVTNGRRVDSSASEAVARHPAIYSGYAEHPASLRWTWLRLTQTTARRIVCIGRTAEHGVLRLFARQGAKICIDDCTSPFVLPKLDHATWPLKSPDPAHSELRWAAGGGYWRAEIRGQDPWFIRPL